MKHFLLTALAFWAMLGYQSVAQNRSVNIDFENELVDGTDIKNGFGDKYTYESTDNPSVDGINTSSYALYVEKTPEAVRWDGPLLRIPDIEIKADDPSTHFLHFQCLLPNGTVEGKGKFVFNLFSSSWDSFNGDGTRLLRDSDKRAQLAFPEDYKPGTWVQFHVDLRSFVGNTLTMMQIQGEKGGSLSWFFDNLVVDDQKPDGFPTYDFPYQEALEDGEDYYIFMEGTKYALTSGPLLSSGNTQTSFRKFQADNDDRTFFQTWTVEEAEATQAGTMLPLYNLNNDGNYLYYDGTIRGLSEEVNHSFSWIPGKKMEEAAAVYLKSYGTNKFLKPQEMMADLEIRSSQDSIQWRLVKIDDVEDYLASEESNTTEVLRQVEAGDYYIFFAGTNYCVTDPRLMKGYGVDKKDENENVIHRDTMYVPTFDLYSPVLQEYEDGNEGQKWTVCNYSDDVDNDRKHTFFSSRHEINGFHPLKTQRWHWSRDVDSTSRSVGARLICGQTWYPQCHIDTMTSSGENVVLDFEFPYLPVWGDNGTMIGHNNNQKWLIKRLPYNKDGMVAIYRPNFAVQTTYVAKRYDGAGISATTNKNDFKNKDLKSQYVWNFVPVDDPAVQSAEAAKSLIVKDTVFGLPTTITSGKYRIVYRGTNQVVTKYSFVNDDEERVSRPKFSKFDKENSAQLWTIDETTEFGYENKNEYTISDDEGHMLLFKGNPDKPTSRYYLTTSTKEEAEAAGYDLEGFAVELLKTNASDYGVNGAYVIRANSHPSNPSMYRYLDPQEKLKRTFLTSSSNGGDFPFVFVPENGDLPEITQELCGVETIEDGYYYIQYIYGYDTINNDPTIPFVLAPANPLNNGDLSRMVPFNKDSAHFAWYLANTDTVARTEGREGDGRFIFLASDSVRPMLDAGITVNQILNQDAKALAISKPYAYTDQGFNIPIRDVAQIYTWLRFRFFEHDGSLGFRTHRYRNVCVSEQLDSLDVKPIDEQQGWSATSFRKPSRSVAYCNPISNPRRACIWNLVPVDGGEPIEVSQFAPWNRHYVDTDEEQISESTTNGNLDDYITVEKNRILFSNVAGKFIELYSISGLKLVSIKSAKTMEKVIVPNGIYVVRIDSNSSTVIVK